jgi:hypothetical protein
MEADADARAYEALSKHPRLGVLATLTRSLMKTAAEARSGDVPAGRVADLATELGVTHDEATTPFGNALDVLSRGPEDDAERALACALAAHAIANEPPKDRDEEDRLSGDLLWLATHTPLDATGLLDRALGEAATSVWDAVADRIRRADQAPAKAGVGRGERLVGAVALAASTSKGALRQAATLAGEVRDRKLARVLAQRGGEAGEGTLEPVSGELVSAPRGPLATSLLAVTGLLVLVPTVRLVGRLALGYRRPAVVSIADEGGIRVKSRTELLGRTLRDRDVLVPRAALQRATRDVRYPSLAMYAGLLALAVGSYLGVAAFVDGVRAASPSLLATGLAIVALGLGLDFVLGSLAPGVRGRCRVLFVSRDGVRLCVGGVAAKRADALLARLARS